MADGWDDKFYQPQPTESIAQVAQQEIALEISTWKNQLQLKSITNGSNNNENTIGHRYAFENRKYQR
jgi:hypothetical protein